MPDDTLATLHCANHPDRETMLRCNKCDKPICFQCAVRTPVGYRCKECVRAQQNVYYNGGQSDLLIAGIVALVLGGIFGGLAFAFLGIAGIFSFIHCAVRRAGRGRGGRRGDPSRCQAATGARHEMDRRHALHRWRHGRRLHAVRWTGAPQRILGTCVDDASEAFLPA